MGLKQEMNNLERQLNELEKQIQELQIKCKHPIQKAAFRKPQESSYQVMIVCDDCGKELRYPNEKEKDEFLGR